MIILAKTAAINFIAFLLVIWGIKTFVGKEVSLTIGAFIGVWLIVSTFLWFITASWFIWSL